MTTQSGQSGIPDSPKDILESTALAHVATLGPSGEPQCNPVWFDWDGEYVKVSQTKTRQKYRNVTRDPRIALSIVDLEDPYRYLEIRGVVERIDEDPDSPSFTRCPRSTAARTSTRTTGPATSG
jgi:PPOX class probable F420-dependent enzyme